MKEKIFYIVNLDKKRISLLSLFLVGLLFSFFFLGVSVGKGNAIAQFHKNKLADGIDKPSVEEVKTKTHSEVNVLDKSQEINQNQESPIISNSQDDSITLANKAPEPQVIELKSHLGEDTKMVEAIYNSSDSRRITKKLSPKKVISSPTDSKGLFTIQLAAFSYKQDADHFIKKINSDNPSLKFKPYIMANGKYFLVRIGLSEDKSQLKKLLEDLKIDSNLKKNVIIVKK